MQATLAVFARGVWTYVSSAGVPTKTGCQESDKGWLVVALWDIYDEQQCPMMAWSWYVIPTACLPGVCTCTATATSGRAPHRQWHV